MEVELIERESISSPPVTFAPAPKDLLDESIDALKKQVDLLSEKKQRVKKEMRAKLFGLTKNRSSSFSTNNNKNSPDQNLDELGLNKKNLQKELSELEPGPSTLNQRLSDNLEIGDFTALNTDRHLYYSFYARIEQAIRPPWESEAKRQLRMIPQPQPMKPKGGWMTRIDVILDQEGKLVKVILLKSCGIPSLDKAAIQAFESEKYFPHPPRAMINDEGQIRLKYLFNVF